MNKCKERGELRAWFREAHLNELSVEFWGNHGVLKRTEEEVAAPHRKAERTGIKSTHTR